MSDKKLKEFAKAFGTLISTIDPVANSKITPENTNVKLLCDWGRRAIDLINTPTPDTEQASKDKQIKDEAKHLKWFISTLRDVLAYNEHEAIEMQHIEDWLMEAEESDVFTKDAFESIYKKILEVGYATLPTTEKAIRKYGQ